MIMMTHIDDHDDNVHDDEAKARPREVRFHIEFCDLGGDKAKMWCLAPSDCHRSRKILILHNSDDDDDDDDGNLLFSPGCEPFPSCCSC